ncbi:cell cycle control protein [Anaeramoeba ignava]|uniref:Cell cycle control protein n=1 Tax=Anaeramoeba ignava TaxID=1746090 RepID=A0A9Q0LV80_ANAIG|nr:cell cycle control protein [Anaeramoeba ignava]
MLRKSSSQKPKNTPFRQQKLKAWQPILTPRIIIPCSFIFGFFFLLIGILLVVSVNSVVEFSKRYDNLCAEGANCTITIDISKKMKHPVYFYYELTNFYQNHRRYVKSRCDEQLRGQSVTYNDMKDCKPKRSRNDKDNPDDFYLPCGLIAASNFNDTFTIKNQASEVVGFDSSGIAWKSDLEKKFKVIQLNFLKDKNQSYFLLVVGLVEKIIFLLILISFVELF